MEIRLILLLSLFATTAKAQTFTDYLTRSAAGEGLVIIHQDAEIEALVNAVHQAVSHTQRATSSSHPSSHHMTGDGVDSSTTSSEQVTTPVAGRRMKASGYRIQIYAGGNNRQAKSEAYHMASLMRSTFSDINVYTNFISPRWTCRVGDFKTQEEAAEMLQRIRETQKFREASIVKSQIIVVY